jgi:hypothetical protein
MFPFQETVSTEQHPLPPQQQHMGVSTQEVAAESHNGSSNRVQGPSGRANASPAPSADSQTLKTPQDDPTTHAGPSEYTGVSVVSSGVSEVPAAAHRDQQSLDAPSGAPGAVGLVGDTGAPSGDPGASAAALLQKDEAERAALDLRRECQSLASALHQQGIRVDPMGRAIAYTGPDPVPPSQMDSLPLADQKVMMGFSCSSLH